MADFFDARASGYEAHMRASVDSFDALYQGVAAALPDTPPDPKILDLGIGTGLEAERIYHRFPDAQITGIDVSSGMLDTLRAKPWTQDHRLTLIQGSFLEADLGADRYDAAVSVMALHHWGPAVKRALYRRICLALRPGGVFVHGDYVVSPHGLSDEVGSVPAPCSVNEPHLYHIDAPLTPQREQELLLEAGFADVETVLSMDRACVFRARRRPTS